MRSYQDYKIPTAWMLDSGIMEKVSFLCFLCECDDNNNDTM